MGFHFIKITLGLTALFALQACTSGSSSGSLPIGDPNAPSVDSTKPVACTLGTGANTPISGSLSYERIMQSSSGALDFSNIVNLPIRGATVQLMCGSSVVDTDVSGADGSYALVAPLNSVGLVVRVRAELKRSGTPAWDFTVVDNTRDQALYVMDSAPFDLTASISSKNLFADSGFNNSLTAPAYTSDRVAAPFAILDSAYKAREKILLAEPNAVFPALKLNWSVNNNASGNNQLTDIQAGNISSSFFGQPDTSQPPQIYILGDDDTDTDEYDEHVIIHEWGHYFEHYFSRSDSIGGSHSGNDKLDMRVAFGEGFGNAFSAMVTDNPQYKDSQGVAQPSGFSIDVDNNDCRDSQGQANKGFYSECSVQAIMYDLYDSGSEAGDSVSLGFLSLYQVLTNEQKSNSALTSIFSFITPLKSRNPSEAAAIDNLVSDQLIQSVSDIYGSSENTSSNDPGSISVLPVYESIAVGGTRNVCSTAEHFSEFQDKNGNKLGVNRFLRLSLPTAQASITVTASRTSGITSADPDIEVYLKGQQLGIGESTTANKESLNLKNLSAGDYIIVVYEFSYHNGTNSPVTTCFDITVSNP